MNQQNVSKAHSCDSALKDETLSDWSTVPCEKLVWFGLVSYFLNLPFPRISQSNQIVKLSSHQQDETQSLYTLRIKTRSRLSPLRFWHTRSTVRTALLSYFCFATCTTQKLFIVSKTQMSSEVRPELGRRILIL